MQVAGYFGKFNHSTPTQIINGRVLMVVFPVEPRVSEYGNLFQLSANERAYGLARKVPLSAGFRPTSEKETLFTVISAMAI